MAFGSSAVLILGPSGSGKSTLALSLLNTGGRLVSDDRTCLGIRRGRVIGWAPESILGKIEARGIGILDVPYAPPTPIDLVVDLGQIAGERLPDRRYIPILGHPIAAIHGGGLTHLRWAIPLMLSSAAALPARPVARPGGTQ